MADIDPSIVQPRVRVLDASEIAEPTPAPPQPLLRRLADLALLRIAVYYAALASFGLFATHATPGLLDAIDRERTRHVPLDLSSPIAIHGGATTQTLLSDGSIGVVLLSLVAALLLALPLSWVYSWSSDGKHYNQGFAQSLVVFPVAIATVVFLVKGSLALAFSIAGIVAAVRFRNRLSATRDAIFVFVAIGIGLAAGVQLLHVAFLSSLIFNLASLLLVSSDYGAHPSVLRGSRLHARRR